MRYLSIILVCIYLLTPPKILSQISQPDFTQLRIDQYSRLTIHPAGDSARGIALVIHGLNLLPDRMENIIRELNRRSITAVLVHLKGHARLESEDDGASRMTAFKNVSAGEWLYQSRAGYAHAAELATRLNVPLYFVGFSMGGVIGPLLLQSNSSTEFNKMVLLSPALSIRAHAHLLKALSLFPGIVIPSSSPEYYRANRGTPIAGYNAFYNIYAEFRKSVRPERLNVPSLLFIHPKDEFVSASGLRRFQDHHRLSNWKIELMVGSNSPEDSLFHLIIDKQSAGAAKWHEAWEAVDSLLTN